MGKLGEVSVPLGHESCADIQRLKAVLRQKETSQLFERAGLHPSFTYFAVIKYPGKMELRGESVYFSSVPGCHPF